MKSQANLACNNFSTSFYVVWIFNSVLERLGILGLWNGGRRLGWVFGVEHGAFIALSWWPLEGKLVLWALGSSGLPSSHLLWLTWNVLVMSTAETLRKKNTLLSLLVISEVNNINKIPKSLCARTPKIKNCIWSLFLQLAVMGKVSARSRLCRS